jgi:hypothetical protein
MPAKSYDYLTGGLYVAYSISGEIDQLLKNNLCWSKYKSESADELSRFILRLLDCGDFKGVKDKVY